MNTFLQYHNKIFPVFSDKEIFEVSTNQITFFFAMAAMLNNQSAFQSGSSFVKYHLMNITFKFGSKEPSCFGEEYLNVKS